MKNKIFVLLALLLLPMTIYAFDAIHLKNGEVLKGTVDSMDSTSITFTRAWQKQQEVIQISDIKLIIYDNNKVVRFDQSQKKEPEINSQIAALQDKLNNSEEQKPPNNQALMMGIAVCCFLIIVFTVSSL